MSLFSSHMEANISRDDNKSITNYNMNSCVLVAKNTM
jgi:hypothetical protein